MPAVNHSAKLAAAIVAAMRAHGDLSALVSTRIYGGIAAQGSALPRVIFHEISSVTDYSHDSASSTDPGVEDSIIQFDIEALTLSGCRSVADAIAGLFGGARITGATANIQGAFRESGGFAQPLAYDSGTSVTEAHRVSVDYRFLWCDVVAVIPGGGGTPSAAGYYLTADGGIYRTLDGGAYRLSGGYYLTADGGIYRTADGGAFRAA